LHLEIAPDATTYRVSAGEPMSIRHFGEPVELTSGADVTMPTPPLSDSGERPTQPKGREPRPFAEALAE